MGLSVLWVDDEPAVVESARDRLSANGINVVWAAGGAVGLTLAAAQLFDLVILDERMPQLSGMEVLAALRRARNRTPVMILTAYGDDDGILRAGRLGAVKYCHKPLVGEALVQAVHTSVANHHHDLLRPSRGSRPDRPATLTQTTWRPSQDELLFLEELAAQRSTSRNNVLRRLVREAMLRNGRRSRDK